MICEFLVSCFLEVQVEQSSCVACGNTGCGLFGVKVVAKSTSLQVILLMEEILYHLGGIKQSKLWDELPVGWLARFLNHQP